MSFSQYSFAGVSFSVNPSRATLEKRRRGAVIPMVAIMIAAILAVAAFAIDIGVITLADTELQRTADASAIAAVQRLPDETEAAAAAQAVVQSNNGFADANLEISEIHFGFWDRDLASFSSSGGDGVNAVRVTVERTQARGNPLNLFFAHMLGTSQADVAATATAMYDENLCGPLIGIEWVSVPGDPMTDSYRSSRGSYQSQAPRDNGSICSDGPIGLEGNPIVNGDANAGKNYQTTLDGSSIVTGNTKPRLRPLNLPKLDMSSYKFDNDNASLPGIQKGNSTVSPVDPYGDFIVDGGRTYEMPPGNYYLRDFTLTGNSTLKIVGPTNIYLTGALDTSGGYLINTTMSSSNLRIFMSGSTALVTSKVDLYAVIYAPNTDVELRGSADFYGSAVGKTLLATGSGRIHYDEDLDVGDKLDLPRRVSLVQ